MSLTKKELRAAIRCAKKYPAGRGHQWLSNRPETGCGLEDVGEHILVEEALRMKPSDVKFG